MGDPSAGDALGVRLGVLLSLVVALISSRPAIGRGVVVYDSGRLVQAVCPEDMVPLPGFCMDRYEAPNAPGAMPLVARTAQEGDLWCGARGRRLCTEAEWLRACRGVSRRDFPYGGPYERGRCNDDKEWRPPDWKRIARYPAPEGRQEVERLYQADPSGARKGCVSEDGAYDLTGNVAEWVVRSYARPRAGGPQYPHVLKGCYWSGCFGGAPPSCRFTNPSHPGHFRSYEAGFRCCLTVESR